MTLNYPIFTYLKQNMNDNLDNIDRINQKLRTTSIVLLAADILHIKNTIESLSALTKNIGGAVCVNSEALKAIVEMLAPNDFCTDDASNENQELDYDLRTVQQKTNQYLFIGIDECKSRIDAIMTQHKGLQATLGELLDAIRKQNKSCSEVAKND